MTRFVRAGAARGLRARAPRRGGGASERCPHGRARASTPRATASRVAVIPDTQYLFDNEAGDTEPVTDALKWMVDNRATQNIAFAAGLGDVTQDGLENEVARADDAFKILDRAKLPYSVAGRQPRHPRHQRQPPGDAVQQVLRPGPLRERPDVRRRVRRQRLQHRPQVHGGRPRVAGALDGLGLERPGHRVGAVDPRRQQDRADDLHDARPARRRERRAASPTSAATATTCGRS